MDKIFTIGIERFAATKEINNIHRRIFGRFLPNDKNAKILDLGCGYGELVGWLHENGYVNSCGIDLSKEKIAYGRSVGREISVGDILTFEGKDFDVIFMQEILEHIKREDVIPLLKRVKNSLAGNGKLVIQTPNGERIFAGRLRYGDFTHEICFTKRSIEEVLDEVGFTNVKVYPRRPIIHGIASFVRFVMWMAFETICKIVVFSEAGAFGGIFTQNILVEATID